MTDAPLPSVVAQWVDPKTGQPKPELWAFLNSLLSATTFPGPFYDNFAAHEGGVPDNGVYLKSDGTVRWKNNNLAEPPPAP